MGMIRVAGLVAIVPIAWHAAADQGGLEARLLVATGVALVAGAAWLTLSGCFGYGDARRGDWVALIPFAVALVLREGFTVHSIHEVAVHFAQGPIGRHSVVYPLLQLFFLPLVTDAHRFTMHLNGVLGALACLPLYLFVRQRLRSRRAGFLCALFLAVHPLLTRFTPTDGPYALILASWFAGLALLSAPSIDGKALLGGATLLGIAATARMEGAMYLVASLVMLPKRPLIDAARRHRGYAVAAFVSLYALVAAQMLVVLPLHMAHLRATPGLVPVSRGWLREKLLTPDPYAGPVLAILIGIGIVVGVLRRLRLGLTAGIGMLIVFLPVADAWVYGSALHKMLPTFALQAIVAGVGAYALGAWWPLRGRWRWLAVAPGALAAGVVLQQGWSELTKPYLFSEEYTMVRRHLAPGGVARTDCALLTLNVDFVGDIDLHDFRQVVPGVWRLDCRREDCLGAVARGGCVYYVRSSAAYYHLGGVPAACAATGMTPDGDRLACMNDAARELERALALEPVELRTIDIYGSFQDRVRFSPLTAEAGLFRVRTAASPPAPRGTSAAARVFEPRREEGMLHLPGSTIGPAADQPSIPAGQDDLMLAMLGGSDALPGGCKLEGAVSDHGMVTANYTCATGPAAVELAHPTRGAADSVRTARFAITPLAGGAPAALLDEIRARIEAREAEFRWDMLPPPERSPALLPLAIAGAAGVAVLAVALRRPRRGASAVGASR